MNAYKELKADVAGYLAQPGILRPEIDPESYAAEIIATEDVINGLLQFEIPGRYTPTGVPNHCSFDAAAWAAELDEATT